MPPKNIATHIDGAEIPDDWTLYGSPDWNDASLENETYGTIYLSYSNDIGYNIKSDIEHESKSEIIEQSLTDVNVENHDGFICTHSKKKLNTILSNITHNLSEIEQN